MIYIPEGYAHGFMYFQKKQLFLIKFPTNIKKIWENYLLEW